MPDSSTSARQMLKNIHEKYSPSRNVDEPSIDMIVCDDVDLILPDLLLSLVLVHTFSSYNKAKPSH